MTILQWSDQDKASKLSKRGVFLHLEDLIDPRAREEEETQQRTSCKACPRREDVPGAEFDVEEC